jgi:hypothetical protein
VTRLGERRICSSLRTRRFTATPEPSAAEHTFSPRAAFRSATTRRHGYRLDEPIKVIQTLG